MGSFVSTRICFYLAPPPRKRKTGGETSSRPWELDPASSSLTITEQKYPNFHFSGLLPALVEFPQQENNAGLRNLRDSVSQPDLLTPSTSSEPARSSHLSEKRLFHSNKSREKSSTGCSEGMLMDTPGISIHFPLGSLWFTTIPTEPALRNNRIIDFYIENTFVVPVLPTENSKSIRPRRPENQS